MHESLHGEAGALCIEAEVCACFVYAWTWLYMQVPTLFLLFFHWWFCSCTRRKISNSPRSNHRFCFWPMMERILASIWWLRLWRAVLWKDSSRFVLFWEGWNLRSENKEKSKAVWARLGHKNRKHSYLTKRSFFTFCKILLCWSLFHCLLWVTGYEDYVRNFSLFFFILFIIGHTWSQTHKYRKANEEEKKRNCKRLKE